MTNNVVAEEEEEERRIITRSGVASNTKAKSPLETTFVDRKQEDDFSYHRKYAMGLVPTKRSLELADSINATSFCRRRLPVVMVRNHMSENLKTATTFIEQGHVRVGPEVVTDPAFLVTRNLEDFITWTDTSAIRKQVLEYNEQRDDFDLMS